MIDVHHRPEVRRTSTHGVGVGVVVFSIDVVGIIVHVVIVVHHVIVVEGVVVVVVVIGKRRVQYAPNCPWRDPPKP